MSDLAVVFNPAAHSERAASWRETLLGLPGDKELFETRHPGDATLQTRRALEAGFRRIVAAGGDGTVNEVVRALRGREGILGVLPLGTVNVLALELQLPVHSLERCWDVILAGETRRLDLGLARHDGNETPFVQLAGAGLDAAVVQATTPESKKVWGPLSYVLSLAEISTRTQPRIQVELSSGESLEGGLVLIGNGRFYGGPLAFFPDAQMDDGLLDVAVFEKHSPWDLLRYFQGVLFGQHVELPDVTYRQTTRARLDSSGEAALEIDGEPGGVLPVEFALEPAGLEVFVPGSTKVSVEN